MTAAFVCCSKAACTANCQAWSAFLAAVWSPAKLHSRGKHAWCDMATDQHLTFIAQKWATGPGMFGCTCKVRVTAYMQNDFVVPVLQQAQHRLLPQSQPLLQGHQLQQPPSVNLHHQWDEPCLLQHQTVVWPSNHTYK